MRILLTAGGTGGHVFPALSLGEELRRVGVEVIWTGRHGELEWTVAQEHGFVFEGLAATGFYGKRLATKLLALRQATVGFFNALGVLRRLRPDGVVATGGFASVAMLGAAALVGLPFFLLEQNRVPGKVTHFFAPHARESYLTFPTFHPFLGRHAVLGCPLRPELVSVARDEQDTVQRRIASGKKTVLILGGSGGARALSLAGLDAAAALTSYRFLILAGRRDYERVRSLVRTQNCEVVEFTSRPQELYRQATLAVSRAGGVALSELAAFGLPAILVPFPHATDGHQEANARYAAATGAALVLDESSLSSLASVVQELLGSELRLAAMSAAARGLARLDAARAITERIRACLAG
jgi:UDP-N-acetylglucosamine--N-acetylmuramyl-(pentapeptide) pyrophosphoryl-undecaprenol N-acetylglucosamine transferase